VSLTAKEELELFEKYAKATKKEKEKMKPKIIMQYYNFCLGMSKKYTFKLFEREDVLNEIVIGLDKCIDRYDYTKGFRFYTYAFRTIDFYLRIFYYNNNNTVKIPQLATQQMRKFKKELEQGDSLDSIQEKHNIDDLRMKIIEETFLKINTLSLDYNVENNPKKALKNIIAVEQDEELPELLHYIDRLVDRERIILEMVYKQGLNQNEISEKLGFTRQHISLIKIKGIKNLKKIIKKELNK
jgi:RNA polymerase nonessential primary-like sigma factor